MTIALQHPDNCMTAGWPYATTGLVCGPELEDSRASIDPSQTRLAFELHCASDDVLPPEYRAVVINRNGRHETTEPAREFGPLTPFLVEAAYNDEGYDNWNTWPVMLDAKNNAAWENHDYLWRHDIGADRVRIRWTDAPTDADFYSFVVYYDAGAGGAVDTQLAEIRERAVREYVTDELDAGTYVFRIEYKDRVGNISAYNETVSATIVAPPSQPDTPTAAFANDALTFTFEETGLIYVWANYAPGYGMTSQLFWDVPFGLKANGETTFTTRKLWQGLWRFAFTTREAHGIDSQPSFYSCRLVNASGSLALAAEFGNPYDLRAIQGTDGDITVHWLWDGAEPVAAVTEIWTSADGAAYVLAGTGANAERSFSFTPSDGVEYDIKARSKHVSGGVTAYGDYTDAVTITADNTAPTGDTTITAEVIH